jgi:hypothetical protein
MYVLEDKHSRRRRGIGPRSVHPIPDFTMNASDEQIYAGYGNERGDDAGSSSTTTAAASATAGYEVDLESARAAIHSRGTCGGGGSGGGVIVKQTSVEVIESRRTEEREGRHEVGDYYLLRQSRREAERMARQASTGKRRRTGSAFGIGRSV